MTPGVLRCVLPGAAAMVLVWALVPEKSVLTGVAACYGSFFAVYLLSVYFTRMDELKEIFSGKSLSASPEAHEQILIGREET
jgi:hypothetical protein